MKASEYSEDYSLKSCKGYCMRLTNTPEAKKVCNLPKCKNFQRANKLLRKYSEKLLKAVEKQLY